MKDILRPLLVLLALLSLSSAASAQLRKAASQSAGPLPAGTYTIDSTGGDFPSVVAAAVRLDSDGIAGPVIFNMAPGVYTGFVKLKSVPGTSTTNTITFQGTSDDSTAATIDFIGQTDKDYGTLWLEKTSDITFRKLRIRGSGSGATNFFTIINEGCHNISFFNCSLEGSNSSFNSNYATVSSHNNDSNVVLMHNRIVGYSSTGVAFANSTWTPSKSPKLIGNIIGGGSEAIYMEYVEYAQIEGNIISSGFKGLDIDGSYVRVVGNQISIQNEVGKGIVLSYSAGLVANNMIISAINHQVVNQQFGIEVDYPYAIDIVHNSVELRNGGNLSNGIPIGISVDGTTIDTPINIFNNVVRVELGYALSVAYSPDGLLVRIDNNDLLSRKGQLVKQYTDSSRSFATLAEWQARSGQDLHSISVDPGYKGDFDLHTTNPALKGKGRLITSIHTDFDGQTRDPLRPDIGADEQNAYAGTDTAYTPMPTKNASWRVQVCGFGCDTSRYWIVKDTSLYRDYHAIYKTRDVAIFDSTKAQYVGGIIEDITGRVYILRPGRSSPIQEQLLYDFGAMPGDTLKITSWSDTLLIPAVVYAADSVLVDGRYCRRLQIGEFNSDRWIEGIGSIGDVIYPNVQAHVSDYAANLLCFRQNERNVYGSACTEPSASVEQSITSIISARVDVAGSTLQITVPDDVNYQLTIYDITGREIMHRSGRGAETMPHSLNEGAYLYRLKIGTTELQQGKIVVR